MREQLHLNKSPQNFEGQSFPILTNGPGGGGTIRGGSARKGHLFQASGIKKGRDFTS